MRRDLILKTLLASYLKTACYWDQRTREVRGFGRREPLQKANKATP